MLSGCVLPRNTLDKRSLSQPICRVFMIMVRPELDEVEFQV